MSEFFLRGQLLVRFSWKFPQRARKIQKSDHFFIQKSDGSRSERKEISDLIRFDDEVVKIQCSYLDIEEQKIEISGRLFVTEECFMADCRFHFWMTNAFIRTGHFRLRNSKKKIETKTTIGKITVSSYDTQTHPCARG